MADVIITQIDHQYDQQIQNLSVDNLGVSTTIKQIYSFIYGAFVDNQLVGFVHGYTQRSKNEPGMIKTIVVDKQYQKQKIGYVLFGYAEDHIVTKRSPKPTTIIVPAWKHNTINLQSILDKHQFTQTSVVTRPWEPLCNKNQFICPAKQPRCCCDLVWFTKNH